MRRFPFFRVLLVALLASVALVVAIHTERPATAQTSTDPLRVQVNCGVAAVVTYRTGIAVSDSASLDTLTAPLIANPNGKATARVSIRFSAPGASCAVGFVRARPATVPGQAGGITSTTVTSQATWTIAGLYPANDVTFTTGSTSPFSVAVANISTGTVSIFVSLE
jgi:hypothetical protein